jgi:hypothetical protein
MDVDLIVGPVDLPYAEQTLAELHFQRQRFEGLHRIEHADTWTGGANRISVDLHRSLLGANAAPHVVWKALARDTEVMEVGGADVEVLSIPGKALHVALHATQHGASGGKSLADLTRALEQMSANQWEQSARLAEEIQAVEAFAAGLRLLPGGVAVAERLRLPTTTSVKIALQASSAPPTSLGLERLASTPGVRARTRLVFAKLFPDPVFMRTWSLVARKGPVGLAASYVLRPIWLLWRIGPALAARNRAKREARGP